MTGPAGLLAVPIAGLPLFAPGMSVADEIVAALTRAGEALGPKDVIVVAQKIVSKSEGRLRDLAQVSPGEEAWRIAGATGREPEHIELILAESTEIMRAHPAAVIARHRTGHVLANAGIDASNVEGGEQGSVLLWPEDPDASARGIREEIEVLTGMRPGLIIADSMGRAWRVGTVGTAIGCAGIVAVDDRRGQADLFGRVLQATIVAIADSIAAMATLAMGEGAEGTPAAIVRGAGAWVSREHGLGALSLVRPIEQDMFR
jgi:coenzyme F420-0:L-glutamate ligase/coenzyme F420-1:gamma-L-glutamate ligase